MEEMEKLKQKEICKVMEKVEYKVVKQEQNKTLTNTDKSALKRSELARHVIRNI